MPAEKTQSFCPCSRVLNRSDKGLSYYDAYYNYIIAIYQVM